MILKCCNVNTRPIRIIRGHDHDVFIFKCSECGKSKEVMI